MKQIPDNERAKIVAVILRLISELAGCCANDDTRVELLMGEIMDLCFRTKAAGTPAFVRALFFDSVDFAEQKDWLFAVKKIGESFQFEAKFGSDIKTANLESSVKWVAKAGVN
jgi:hypothetical protein